MGRLYIESPDKKIALNRIADAVYKVTGQTENIKAELVFTDAAGIKDLNMRTRGIDKVTDVLSYPSFDGIRGKILNKEECSTELDGKYIFIGSIVLCESKIKEQAAEFGHGEITERTYLIIHGLMHLFGYDHMTDEDKKQMRDMEKKALALLGVNND